MLCEITAIMLGLRASIPSQDPITGRHDLQTVPDLAFYVASLILGLTKGAKTLPPRFTVCIHKNYFHPYASVSCSKASLLALLASLA